MKAFLSAGLGLLCSMLATTHLNQVESRNRDSDRVVFSQQRHAYMFMIEDRLRQLQNAIAALEENPIELRTDVSRQVAELTVLQAKLRQKLQEARRADGRKWRTLKYEIVGWIDRTDKLLDAGLLRG